MGETFLTLTTLLPNPCNSENILSIDILVHPNATYVKMILINVSLLIYDVEEVRKHFYHCAVFFNSGLLMASSEDLIEDRVPIQLLVDDPCLNESMLYIIFQACCC